MNSIVLHFRRVGIVVLTIIALLLGALGAGPVEALPPLTSRADGAKDRLVETAREGIAADKRDSVLGEKWRTSDDVMLYLNGDATGLHVLVSRESKGYAWETLTSLSEPGVETDRWIGNGCVTGDGRHVAVVYAPRAATNDSELMQRGGFGAVIDMRSGRVRKLPFGATLAYYNPGCGVGAQAVFSQYAGMDESRARVRTRLQTVDASSGRLRATQEVKGQLSSVVPNAAGLFAVRGRSIVKVNGRGAVKDVARTEAVPHRLVSTGFDSVAYLTQSGSRAVARELVGAGTRPTTRILGGGDMRRVSLDAGVEEKAVVSGLTSVAAAKNPRVQRLPAASVAGVSSRGHAAIVNESMPEPYLGSAGEKVNPAWIRMQTSARVVPGESAPVKVTLRILRTKKLVRFTIEPRAFVKDSGTGQAVSPMLSGAAPTASRSDSKTSSAALVSGSSTSTVDSDAVCAVPRNDPKTQVYQPTPRQVEWAADQAVVGNLKPARAANWKQSGMPNAWTPQGLIGVPTLNGGGRVPVQILLGILAQESNLWQSSGHNLPGVPGNPLVGNYYGRSVDPTQGNTADDFNINWAKADCGYGVGQVTDGMRKGDARGAFEQRAIAVDYATNIAASLEILVEKWNETRAAGVIHDDGKPEKLENWIFAIWSYNTGFKPKSATGPWGVGWVNNPINPLYDRTRYNFLTSPNDAAHPQDWPYQEKVIGFAAYSISTVDGPGFRGAWWVDAQKREGSKPPIDAFCKPSNSCYPDQSFDDDHTPCGHRDSSGALDYKCWWNAAMSYQKCSEGHCGNEFMRFNTTYPEQPDGAYYPPNCTRSDIPSDVLIVDDVPASAPPISTTTRPCNFSASSSGSFALTMAEPAVGKSPARVDLHQSGAGFGGHVWWTHTRTQPRNGVDLEISGTWQFSDSLNQYGRVMVHMPDYAAQTQRAGYVIDNGAGLTVKRYALQRTRKNGWVSLGVVKFVGRPRITLSSKTGLTEGDDDIAWDAVAVQPLSAKPKHQVVALGDSYTSGEGASITATRDGEPDHGSSYYKETDFGGHLDNREGRNACHRSREAWPRKTQLSDKTASIGARADSWDTSLDFQFLACSGAQSFNVNDSSADANAFGELPRGQYGEMSQIDKGYLTPDTTLVMLSIGGNDAGFKDVITNCFYSDCDVFQRDLADKIQGPVKSSVLQTLRRIRVKAPNARIVLMGYPVLLSGTCPNVATISQNEVDWLREILTGVTPSVMRSIVSTLRSEGASIEYADPVSDFAGRGICGDPEHIRGVVQDTTEGDKPKKAGVWPPSAQSFHPNVDGTSDYASAARRAILALGL